MFHLIHLHLLLLVFQMALDKIFLELLCIVLIDALVVSSGNERNKELKSDTVPDMGEDDSKLADVFNGVYTECFLHLSYSCLQRKTLLYLRELNKLSEVSVIGDYVKFVKLNFTDNENSHSIEDLAEEKNSEELSFMIDKAVDKFFNNRIMKLSALGRNISVPNTVEGFVGRKKRKGGGGGGGGGHDDGGKKKMMMMAMMCMKMKLMMMIPAMMGMMGMMTFKGMMFSMMSFMVSKMMLLMKLLEKKGGFGGGGGGGGGDGGWAAGGGGGGGAWMPAGGQDYGGGGGYDANGQWQSRSIIELNQEIDKRIPDTKPIISYVIPTIRYDSKIPHKNSHKTPKLINEKSNNSYAIPKQFNIENERIDKSKVKSRKKRGIMDTLQNVYSYWMNQVLGAGNRRKSNFPKYKYVNGIKYVYHPRVSQKFKAHQTQIVHNVKTVEDNFRPLVIAEDFNKGETVEGPIESRMNRKKFHKMKDTMNDTIDDNPWE